MPPTVLLSSHDRRRSLRSPGPRPSGPTSRRRPTPCGPASATPGPTSWWSTTCASSASPAIWCWTPSPARQRWCGLPARAGGDWCSTTPARPPCWVCWPAPRRPQPAVVDHAFSRIADAPRRGRTLAHHLAALYETICPECAQTIIADRFVWDRSVGEPVEKRYRCPHCGSQGNAPADMVDVAQVASLEVRGAAYWGLLSRLVKPGDALTAQAREPAGPLPAACPAGDQRAADGRRAAPERQRRAARGPGHDPARVGRLAWPASSCSAGHGPARLQLPRRFAENNLWLAFEHAHRTLRGRPHGNQPASTGRCLAADLARLRAPGRRRPGAAAHAVNARAGRAAQPRQRCPDPDRTAPF